MAVKKAVKPQRPVIRNKPELVEDQIRQRAYEIYCARNGGQGSEVDDWLTAETEFKKQRGTNNG